MLAGNRGVECHRVWLYVDAYVLVALLRCCTILTVFIVIAIFRFGLVLVGAQG
jgi:hypothetical protein